MNDEQKQKLRVGLQKLSDQDLRKELIAMDKKKDEIKAFYERQDLLLEEAASRVLGELESCHFQDEEGTVYQLGKWEGQFVMPKEFVLNRTRREGERAGTISMSKARELGYEVEGK